MNTLKRAVLGLAVAMLLIPAAASAQGKTGTLTVPIVQTLPAGTLTNGTAFPGGTFVGTLTASSFQAVNNQIVATGTLTGQILNSSGQLVSTVITQVSNIATTLTGDPASCSILHLTLGPINLNLLGLVVTTNQIVIDISAQPGPGNLLGNLLCSVANLLNGGGTLQQIVALLQQILAAL